MKTKTILTTLSIVASTILVGCGGGSSSTTTNEKQVGTFIDSAVAGAKYTTSSGLSGTTDKYGHFEYHNGDTVEFRIGNLILGEAEPQEDGLITPQDLAENNESIQTLILQTLQTLDEDKNASNGITISSTIIDELSNIETTFMEQLDETKLLHINDDFANCLDTDNDGNIDTPAKDAQEHFEHSLENWGDGNYTQATNTPHGNGYHGGDYTPPVKNPYMGDGNEHHAGDYTPPTKNPYMGDGNNTQPDTDATHGNGHKGEVQDHPTKTPQVDVTDLPKSKLTQELKNSIAYMGNKERLAYDIYTNLYKYHLENNALKINQLQNIATRSERKHIQIIQDLVKKYNLTQDDLSIISSPIVDNAVAFENMPHDGEYGIEEIQELYNKLYEKGIKSQKDALEVGCMVEVTDIEDLDKYIQLAQESNASDVEQTFTQLRNGSYNHYWSFDKALKNLGYDNGCYIPDDSLLGEKKDELYPKEPTSNKPDTIINDHSHRS